MLRFLEGQNKPCTPSHIAKRLGLNRNKVSETLSDLLEHGLVRVLNPDAAYDRLYRITAVGRSLLRRLKDLERLRRL